MDGWTDEWVNRWMGAHACMYVCMFLLEYINVRDHLFQPDWKLKGRKI